MTGRVRAVVFDMDGVLCDSEAWIAAAAARMFEDAYGVKVSPEDFRPFVGAGEDRFIGGVAAQYGVKLSMPRDKQRTYDIYLELIKGRLEPLPGVHAFVERCRATGLKTAVASSADLVKVRGNLTEIRLPIESFDVCLTGDDVVNKKPHPDIFLAAARRLAVEPADCLVVEDAPNGVRSAKAAGCRCLGLTSSFRTEELRGAGADWVASDLAHAPADLRVCLWPAGPADDR